MSEGKIVPDLRNDGQVLHLLLNAPKGNVLDMEMMSGLESALEAHRSNSRIKALVLEGAGKHFSFGASVEEHTKDRVGEMLPTFHRLFRRLLDFSTPTIAVVRGQCLGGALELVSYATWIFASPDAVFGQPEIKLGVFPPVASVLLPWRLGGGAAMDLCVSGRSIGAEEAKRIGLVHEVAEDPSAAAESFLEQNLLGLSASSLKLAERAVRAGLPSLLSSTLNELERLYLDELMSTHDANEGIQSFIERRKPVFRT